MTDTLAALVKQWREAITEVQGNAGVKPPFGVRSDYRDATVHTLTHCANQLEEALAAIVAPHQLPELTNQLIGTLHAMTREQLLDWLAELYEAQGLLGVDRLAPQPQTEKE